MRCLVTGAAGFIGSHVADLLVQSGHEVLGLDDLSGGFVENVPSAVRFEKRSIVSNLNDLFSKFKPQAVYHLAAYAAEGLSHHIPVFNYQNNIVGTANVLAEAYRSGADYFVFTSSIAAYGHPDSSEPFSEDSPCHPCDPYGVAKLACEYHIRSFNAYYQRPAYTIFRPHNVYGPGQNVSDPYRNVAGIFMNRALRGLPMPIFGDGMQTRSFSYISGVARCIAEAPFTPAAQNMTINVGGDEALSVRDLALRIAEAMNVSANLEFLPPRNEVKHAHCKHDLARRVFPGVYRSLVPIDAGLKLMADNVRSRSMPKPTECPSSIEIVDRLPPSWNKESNQK